MLELARESKFREARSEGPIGRNDAGGDDDVNTFYSIENFVIRENQRIVNNQNDNNQNMEKFMWEGKDRVGEDRRRKIDRF